MSLRGRRLLLSPGGALQWWLGIMALGGKRGRAQRVHRRLFRDGEGGPAGPTVLGAAVLAAANGTTGKGAAVIHKFHALSKSLEREKRAGWLRRRDAPMPAQTIA
ncbi:hypothetical protein T484DRAFT_1778780 [Baffinella frigidus]|nr:hypothetical protein T484DRAFT_1778780 [Cryptophyta sp. CCMP2293]